jgi:hypothetical protein
LVYALVWGLIKNLAKNISYIIDGDKFSLEISKQTMPFAVLCVAVNPGTKGTSVSDECADWHDSFLAAINQGMLSDVVVYADSSHEITALLKTCSRKEAAQTSRIVRSLMMIDYPSAKPYFSTIFVEHKSVNAPQVLSQLRENLDAHIDEDSSRIEVNSTFE